MENTELHLETTTSPDCPDLQAAPEFSAWARNQASAKPGALAHACLLASSRLDARGVAEVIARECAATPEDLPRALRNRRV